MNAIIFDLDNTLFNVEKYIYGAFERISEYLSKKYNLSKRKIQNNLITLWKQKTSMYPNLFNDLIKELGLNEKIENIVEMYNNYNGKIKPDKNVITTLKELKRRGYKLGIITDGNVQRQKRKIKILGIQDFFDIIIYTYEMNSPKPSKIPFREAISKLNLNPSMTYYIGDNPLIDFKGAKEIGLFTIRIKSGEFKKLPKNEFIDIQINKIDEIIEIFDNFNKLIK